MMKSNVVRVIERKVKKIKQSNTSFLQGFWSNLLSSMEGDDSQVPKAKKFQRKNEEKKGVKSTVVKKESK